MPNNNRQRLFQMTLLAAFCLQLSEPLPARAPAPHWEKIHVYHAAATVIFARLGLTHSTKNGYTRDGKHGVADPSFPPGLTDVVPNDAESILLARGTDGGLTLFRTRVTAADVAVPPLHLKAELTRRDGAEDIPVGSQEIDSVSDGVPNIVTFGDERRVYQVTERTNPDGSLWIACRVSLPLPPIPPGSDQATPPPAVFVPNQVWTDPLSRKVRPGEIAVFNDLASQRQAASRKLGMTTPDSTDDYTLRVTLTAIPAPATQ